MLLTNREDMKTMSSEMLDEYFAEQEEIRMEDEEEARYQSFLEREIERAIEEFLEEEAKFQKYLERRKKEEINRVFIEKEIDEKVERLLEKKAELETYLEKLEKWEEAEQSVFCIADIEMFLQDIEDQIDDIYNGYSV